MNNKITCFLIFFILISTYSLLGQRSPKLWGELYQNSKTIKQKKDIIVNIYDVATKDFEVLILIIFQDIFEHPDTKMALKKLYFEESVYYLTLMMNKLDIKTKSAQLKLLYERINNPLYKGEILAVIGKSGDKNLLPWLNELLKKMNIDHRIGKFYNQQDTLYGLIKALGYYNDASSFRELFYVSIPNYSNKVRTLAQGVLKKITNAPSPFCDNIITIEKDYRITLEALRYSVKSESPDKHKIKTCLIVLSKAMDEVIIKTEDSLQNQLRDEAAIFLGELKAADIEAVQLLSRKWKFDKGINSRLVTIEALQKIGTDEAAKELANRLAFFIEMKFEGAKTGYLEKEGKRVFIAILRALSDIGSSSIGIKEIYQVSASQEFESEIREEALRALKKLEGK
ncbi:MAG: hypothetical protein KAT05_03880 [Spirochaetes bacterium]|nr:hypothetical protein [Spirochaetota bacterium]